MKEYFIGSIIIGIAIVCGFAFFGGGTTVVEQYGASSGPDHYNLERFMGGVLLGGQSETITAVSTTTLTAKQVCEGGFIEWAPGTNLVATTTLPAASAITSYCMGQDGDTKIFYLRNASTTASEYLELGTTTQDLATGTKIFVAYPTKETFYTTNVASTTSHLRLGPEEWFKLTLHRASSTEVEVFVERIYQWK